MTVKEAAAALGISERGVYAAIAKQELPHYRYGSKIVIEPSDLEDYRAAHRVERPGKRQPSRSRTGRSRAKSDGLEAFYEKL